MSDVKFLPKNIEWEGSFKVQKKTLLNRFRSSSSSVTWEQMGNEKTMEGEDKNFFKVERTRGRVLAKFANRGSV